MMVLMRSAMIGHRRGSGKKRADIATGKTLGGRGKRQNQTQREDFESQCHSSCGGAATHLL